MERTQTRELPQQRPRSNSKFSFKSQKSHESHGSQNKKAEKSHHLHLHHRHSSKDEHKPHFTATTKADPNAAMNEVQPIATALEKPTLQSLRSFNHTDINGQPIEEPDLSNPTRSRWERPLDTIRSFEASIDNEYKRRSQVMRNDAGGPSDAMSVMASRRNSYYAGGYEQNRPMQGGAGYYGSRQSLAARDSWQDNGYGSSPAPRARYSRMQGDPSWNRQSNGHNVYPTPGYQQSRDTIITGGSNGSHSEQYSTDPSSDNSSIERGGPVRPPQPDVGEQYGFSGFGGNPQLDQYGNGRGPSNNVYSQQQQHLPRVPEQNVRQAPQPPPHNSNVIKLSNAQNQGPPPAGGNRPNVLARKSTDASDNKKSWLKRRFSKK